MWRCAVLQVPGGPCWTGARTSWLDSRRRRWPRPSLALCWSRVRPLFWVYCASAVAWCCWRRVCPRDHLWACKCGGWQQGAEGTACHCGALTSTLTLSRQRKLFTSSFTLPQSKGYADAPSGPLPQTLRAVLCWPPPLPTDWDPALNVKPTEIYPLFLLLYAGILLLQLVPLCFCGV